MCECDHLLQTSELLKEMRALLQILLSSPFSSSSSSHHRFWNSSLFLHFSSSSINNPNPILINYLIDTFEFSKSEADSVSKCFQSGKTPKEPDSVVHLLREFGFSETQIRNSVLISPRILSFQEKTLKPKLSLFQNELGLTGSHLGRFISNNPYILYASLERRLIPNISLVKKIIPDIQSEESRKIAKFVPHKCRGIFSMDPKRLLSNISFLQSCGIVETQLSGLLKHNASVFTKRESALKDLVRKAQDMGFSCNSKMLVHAIFILSNLSSKTIESKFELLRSVGGLSQEECSAMFRSAPLLLSASEKKLKLGIDFFDGAGFERKMLVRFPICLMLSLEKRVIPRYRVYQILKSKQQQLLNNKCPSFPSMLILSEKRFLETYIFKFGDDAEELLAAYNNGYVLNSSTEQN